LVWAASGPYRRRGLSGRSRHRSSRASTAPTGYAARQAHRVIVLREQARLQQGTRHARRIASSFIAGKHRSHRVRGTPGRSRHPSSRASTAPTGYAARQAHRVIVHCGQAPLPQGTRHARQIASSLIAGKHRSHRVRGTPGASRHRSSRASSAPTGDRVFRWSEACPRIVAPRCSRLRPIYCGSGACPR